MIYGISRSKEEGLGYSEKCFYPRFGTLIKSSEHSFSSSIKNGLDVYFMPAPNKAKAINQ